MGGRVEALNITQLSYPKVMLFARAKYFTNQLMQGTKLHVV